MPKRVLVVEDDLPTQRLMQEALSEGGFHIATATSPETALGECVASDPDLIVLDLSLAGGGNGASFLRAYRARGGRAKVLVVSGVDSPESLIGDQPVDEIIGKPFDLEHLLRSIQRATPA